MTETTNGRRALPWRSEGYRILDADGIEVANTRTPDLASKTVAKDIVDDVNAYYVGKDARIAELEEGYTRMSKAWAEKAEEAAQLEKTLHLIRNQRDGAEYRVKAFKKRAEAAEARLKDVDGDRWKLLLRAEEAEADLSYYKTASKNFEDSYWEANKRAEEAEARVSELEEKLSEAGRRFAWASDANEKFEVRIWEEQKRAEAAEARVSELKGKLERATWKYGVLDYDRRMGLAKAGAGSAAFLDDEYDDYPVGTFTAPDGRAFRVGQRVYDVVVHEYARVAEAPGGAFPVELQWEDGGVLELLHADHIGDLRRVWDGSEEPDVPVGTVLRDGVGDYWTKSAEGYVWKIDARNGADLGAGDFLETIHGPFVEVLPGDDD